MTKLNELNPNLQRFLINAMNPLEKLGESFSKIVYGINKWIIANEEPIRRFIVIAQNLSEGLKLAEEARNKMITAGFIGGDYSFSLSEIYELGKNKPEEYEDAVYQKTIDEKAEKDLLNLMNVRPILAKRTELVRQAIELHRQKMFSGSVVLLLVQIEGVFNDLLLEKGYAKLGTDGQVVADEKLIGIKSKLNHMNKLDGDQNEILNALLSEAFIENQKPKGFNDFRNSILHGSNIDFANKSTSTKVALWLYAVIYNYCLMQNMAIVKSANQCAEEDIETVAN